MSPVPSQKSLSRDVQVGAWRLWIRSELGLERERLEDAWAVVPEATCGGRRGGTWAVFDGLGGLPHGQEAAWTAADQLPSVLARAKSLDDVLPRLNPAVLSTRGATTAIVLWCPLERSSHSLTLLAVGDSGAYEIGPSGTIRLINEKDAHGPSVVTDFLGNQALSGHRYDWRPEPDATLLLCTDGVDGVVTLDVLGELGASDNPRLSLDRLFDAIFDAGAPDNATAIVARRQ